jgi:hypothetical protein
LTSDPCRGGFPPDARDDAGDVSARVIVRPDGSAASASVDAESPQGQGFGAAARACLLATRFAPGVDRAGAAVTAPAVVHVRFRR